MVEWPRTFPITDDKQRVVTCLTYTELFQTIHLTYMPIRASEKIEEKKHECRSTGVHVRKGIVRDTRRSSFESSVVHYLTSTLLSFLPLLCPSRHAPCGLASPSRSRPTWFLDDPGVNKSREVNHRIEKEGYISLHITLILDICRRAACPQTNNSDPEPLITMPKSLPRTVWNLSCNATGAVVDNLPSKLVDDVIDCPGCWVNMVHANSSSPHTWWTMTTHGYRYEYRIHNTRSIYRMYKVEHTPHVVDDDYSRIQVLFIDTGTSTDYVFLSKRAGGGYTPGECMAWCGCSRVGHPTPRGVLCHDNIN